MPKLDDPNFKLRLPANKFVRKNLRPWNIVEELQIELPPQKEINNSKQTVNNSGTNSNQIVNELVNKNKTISNHRLLNSKQIVNNHETISKPFGKRQKGTISKQIVNQLANDSGQESSILDEIPKLSGYQLKLMMYILENCSSRGLLYTTPITNHTLTMLLQTDIGSVKTTVQRLTNKKLISREQGRPGRGGFCIFRITEEVRSAVLETKRQLGLSEQIVNQLVNKFSKQLVNNQITNQVTHASSSSSVINNKETTTTSQSSDSSSGEELLPQEWEIIDIAPLTEIGFSKYHLKQIANQNKISHMEVQESIHAFAFDLKENNKGKVLKTNPLNYLMGILRNGIPYAPPSNYKSPKEIAMEKLLEQKKDEKERIRKLEDEMIQYEFEEWLPTINESQRNEIVGELQQSHMYSDKVKESVARTRLLEYFKQNIKSTTEKL